MGAGAITVAAAAALAAAGIATDPVAAGGVSRMMTSPAGTAGLLAVKVLGMVAAVPAP
jgi:hypothetical protein